MHACIEMGQKMSIETNSPELKGIREEIYDLIRGIKDPEKPETLEDLKVVDENGIKVMKIEDRYLLRIEFVPTVPHCSLATLIGLCMRMRIERSWNKDYKLDIYLKKGTHNSEDEINKQINDKERIAAAMENPSLQELVEKCISDQE